MNDWVESLVSEIVRAHEAGTRKETRQEVDERARKNNALTNQSSYLWGELREKCGWYVEQSSQRVRERIQKVGEDDPVTIKFVSPQEFRIVSTIFKFSMAVRHDTQLHVVEISGEKQLASAREERRGLLFMDMDVDGKRCFRTVDGSSIDLDSAAYYILQLCVARCPPQPPKEKSLA
jgi:hypothetical protein